MKHTHLPPFARGFVDFHDNGNPCPRGKTRYGLVIDLNGSSERWNINFEVMSEEAYAVLMDCDKLSEEQRDLVTRAATFYVESGLADKPTAFIAPAKRNVLSGKRDPKTGKPKYRLAYDFSVSALIDTTDPEDPIAVIFWGDEVHVLEGLGWYVPVSQNHTIKGRHDV